MDQGGLTHRHEPGQAMQNNNFKELGGRQCGGHTDVEER